MACSPQQDSAPRQSSPMGADLPTGISLALALGRSLGPGVPPIPSSPRIRVRCRCPDSSQGLTRVRYRREPVTQVRQRPPPCARRAPGQPAAAAARPLPSIAHIFGILLAFAGSVPRETVGVGLPSRSGEELMGGFRKFLFRGNLIDLAVAVVIGVAFNALIQALIADIITPLIAAIGGKPNFSSLSLTVNKSHFFYGSFFNALIFFVIIAAVVYYLIVSPAAKFTDLTTRQKEATELDCPECLSSIPIKAKRCMYCTSEVPPVTPPQLVSSD